MLNSGNLYPTVLIWLTIESMLKIFNQLKGRDEYNLSEDEINELGLRLLYDKKESVRTQFLI